MSQRKIMPAAGIVGLFVLTLTACAPSTTPRKKLPGYLSAGNFESGYYFKTKMTQQDLLSLPNWQESVTLEGRPVNMLVFSLPYSEYDAAILSLVQEYKPAALAVLSSWALQQHKGVVIDMRNAPGQSVQEVGYSLAKAGAFDIPVIFRWNQASTARARSFLSLLNETPGITIRQLK
ncbi:hypothetical protein [Niabella hibiscisoli]|uniref:hypothetical protein n=1 Tax=Niabella hibiscisoli TaxID=1825928 RepID=UPI001F0E428F|nr:hypothetical protein [Niabella hibiscisoli]MCH5721101.1 hypothetical protein [Niabella hibiscisoli]